jgi:hypothetical protein
MGESPGQLWLWAPSEIVATGVDARGRRTYALVEGGKPVAWMRPAQLAGALGVSVRTVYDWLASGYIPPEAWERHGKRLLFIAASEAKRLGDTREL